MRRTRRVATRGLGGARTHQATGSTTDDDKIVVIAVVAHGLRHRARRFRRGERFSHSLRDGEAHGRERRRRRVLRARLRDQRAGERAKRAPELSLQGARSALPSRERGTVVDPRGVSLKGDSAAWSGRRTAVGTLVSILLVTKHITRLTKHITRVAPHSKRPSRVSGDPVEKVRQEQGYETNTSGSPVAHSECAPSHAAPRLRRAPRSLGTRARPRPG